MNVHYSGSISKYYFCKNIFVKKKVILVKIKIETAGKLKKHFILFVFLKSPEISKNRQQISLKTSTCKAMYTLKNACTT